MSATTAPAPAPRDRLGFFCLNVGHFLDHLFTLIYATVVSLALVKEWKLSYAELVPLATFGFVAFGLYSLPAGRLADNWSRHGMMVVFFIGIGLASIATSFAANPQQIAVLLFIVGVLAAIYHPVGLAMVVESVRTQGAGAGGTSNTVIFVCLGVGLALLSAAYFMGAASPWLQRGMAAFGLLLILKGLVTPAAGTGMALGINGVWGNLGVGSAALITGFLIDHGGWLFASGSWRAAFLVPGVVSIAIGIAYWALMRDEIRQAMRRARPAGQPSIAETLLIGYLAPVGVSVLAILAWGYSLWAVTACLAAGLAAPVFWMVRQSKAATKPAAASAEHSAARATMIRLTAIIFFTAAVSSLVFQSTTFALPQVFVERLGGIAGSATLVGTFAFVVFAVASLAQLVVGALLDTWGPRLVFMGAALVQIVFFAIMPGLTDWAALAVALGFMLGAFGQIPINDYMIGKMATSEYRAQVYGGRYVVSFLVLGATLPFIKWIHGTWGFDTLFRVLAAAATVIFIAVTLLPRQVPEGGKVAAPAKA